MVVLCVFHSSTMYSDHFIDCPPSFATDRTYCISSTAYKSNNNTYIHVSPPTDRTTALPTSLHSPGTLSETSQCSQITFPNKPNKNTNEAKTMNGHTPTTRKVSSSSRDKEAHSGNLQRAKGERVWTPDRETIDNHLEMMRKRVSVDI